MIGIIFDLDGVLVDTAKYHYLAWRNFASQFNYDFTEEENEAFKGVSRKRCLEILMDSAGIKGSPEQISDWLNQKNEDYLNHITKMDASEVLPGVLRVLNLLKELKVPMAVGSASKNAIPILEKVELLSYFNTVIDGNKVSKAKPDPEVFIKAATALNIPLENAVVFEDAIAGIQAANSAGMLSIGIGEETILSEAKYVFKNFNQISNDFINQIAN
jgi:beta-phosphoglucomutase